MQKLLCCVLSFLVFVGQAFAQIAQSEEPISETQAMLQETARQTENAEDEYEVSPQQRFEENPKHNVHEYNYKQQVVVGGTVMFCVVLAMVLNNNYNPKRGK
jgi:type II secretory pathway component PulM